MSSTYYPADKFYNENIDLHREDGPAVMYKFHDNDNRRIICSSSKKFKGFISIEEYNDILDDPFESPDYTGIEEHWLNGKHLSKSSWESEKIKLYLSQI